MVPAHQQLTAHHGALRIDLGLHIHRQLPFGCGFLKVLFQRQALLHIGLHRGFIKTDAIAPHVFGAVHGGVCFAQQVFGALGLLGKQSDADAAGTAVEMGLDAVGHLQGGTHGLGHKQCSPARPFDVSPQMPDQHHKLVPTEARHRVARAQQAEQALRHLLEHGITHRVATGIVDLLEIVQIDKQHRPHLLGYLCSRDSLLHAVHQHAAIGQLGERIKVGELVRAGLGIFALGDVSRQRNETRWLSGSTCRLARNGQFKPVDLALQIQAKLVARRIARGVCRLQGGAASCGSRRRHDVFQPPAHKAASRLGKRGQVPAAAVGNAPVGADFHEQVWNGVERAGQLVARSAQLCSHGVCQRFSARPARGQQPGEPTQNHAEQSPNQCRQMVGFVLIAVLKCRQGHHAQVPGAPSKRHRTNNLSLCLTMLQARIGVEVTVAVLGVAIQHIQSYVCIELAGQAGNHLRQMKRR